MNDNEPAIVGGMPNDDYHRHQAIGSSGLKLLKQSPLHYWAQYIDPARERTEPTPAMRLGTAWHTAIFEPLEFNQRYMVVPDGLDRRTKEGKALFAEIEAAGLEPLKPDDEARIKRMSQAAHEHPVGKVLFGITDAVCERSMFWNDRATGVRCKMRPDYMIEPCARFPNGLIVDGKSCEDASVEGFGRQCWNYDMPLQAAWYSDGFQECCGTSQPPAFLWMAQEKSAPFATAFYSASVQLIAYGRREYRRLLGVYAECLRSNSWPGYPTAITDLTLPAWAEKAMQDEAA